MARPKKAPLTYFPFSTAFPLDDKIIVLSGEYGAKGEAVLVRLWCALYGTYGYYLPYDETNTPKSVARVEDRRYGVTSSLVVAIVHRAVQVGLFSQRLFKEYKVLTSEAIQQRYFEAVRRRVGVTVYRQYLLVSPPIGVVIVDINPINVDINELNKSKDNILPNGRILSSKERENNFLYKPPVEKEKKEKEIFSVVETFFFRNFSTPAAEAERFRNHYAARGWRDRAGNPLIDITALARSWEQRRNPSCPHHPKALSLFRKFYSIFREELPPDKRDELLSLIYRLDIDDKQNYFITCPTVIKRYLEDVISSHRAKVVKVFCGYRLFYRAAEK